MFAVLTGEGRLFEEEVVVEVLLRTEGSFAKMEGHDTACCGTL